MELMKLKCARELNTSLEIKLVNVKIVQVLSVSFKNFKDDLT